MNIFQTTVPPEKRKVSKHIFYYQTPATFNVKESSWLGIPKLNLKWWLISGGGDCPVDWKVGYKPEWWRKVSWFIRNPLMNFKGFVLGHADKCFVRYGVAPDTTWSSDKSFTFNPCVNRLGIFFFPFISGRIWPIEFTLGWTCNGYFAVALRHFKSKGYEDTSSNTWKWW